MSEGNNVTSLVSKLVMYEPDKATHRVCFVQKRHGDSHLVLFDLEDQESLAGVCLQQCRELKPRELKGGLMHFVAFHASFGEGVVVEESVFLWELSVRLKKEKDRQSVLLPWTMITLCKAPQ